MVNVTAKYSFMEEITFRVGITFLWEIILGIKQWNNNINDYGKKKVLSRRVFKREKFYVL